MTTDFVVVQQFLDYCPNFSFVILWNECSSDLVIQPLYIFQKKKHAAMSLSNSFDVVYIFMIYFWKQLWFLQCQEQSDHNVMLLYAGALL